MSSLSGMCWMQMACDLNSRNQPACLLLPQTIRRHSNFVVTVAICLLLLAQGHNSSAQQSIDLVAIMVGGAEFTVSPIVLSPSGTITLSRWQFRNAGNSTVSFTVGVYVSQDPIISRSDRLIDRQKHELAGGELASWGNFSHSLSRLALDPGEYYVGILVDDLNTVSESNETNNILVTALPMTIRILPPVNAELIPSNPLGVAGPTVFAPGDVKDAIVSPGRMANVAPEGTLVLSRWRVANTGTQDAPIFRVGYYLSSDVIITRQDTLLDSTVIDGLKAGSVYQTSLSAGEIRLPAHISPGDYFFGILVDDLGEVGELGEGKEANNSISTPIRVVNAPSDGTRVSRVQIRLKTGTGSNHGTNDDVYVSLNLAGNKTWVDYARNDFERGDSYLYDLVLEHVVGLGDIQWVEIGKDGTDGWCIKEVELRIDMCECLRVASRRAGG